MKDTEENLISRTCKELGLTYEELGSHIGMTGNGIQNALTRGVISKQTKKGIELFRENIALKAKLKELDELKILLNKFLKSDYKESE